MWNVVPAPLLAEDDNVAVARLDHAMDHRQTQAGPLSRAFRGEEGSSMSAWLRKR